MTSEKVEPTMREMAERAIREHLPPHQAARFWPRCAKYLARDYLKTEAELASLRARLDAMEGLCGEAVSWLDDPDAHAEANGTGQIKKWRARYDALAGETKL